MENLPQNPLQASTQTSMQTTLIIAALIFFGVVIAYRARSHYSVDSTRTIGQKFRDELKTFFSFGLWPGISGFSDLLDEFWLLSTPVLMFRNLTQTYAGAICCLMGAMIVCFG